MLGSDDVVGTRARALGTRVVDTFDSTQDREFLANALNWALRCCDGQYRQGIPYFVHVADVAERVLEWFGGTDAEVIAAALLHDALEDNPALLAARAVNRRGNVRLDAHAAITEMFSGRVAEQVWAVTNPVFSEVIAERYGYRARTDAYDATLLNLYAQHFVDLFERGPMEAIAIKLADMRDNAVNVGRVNDPGTYAWLVRKYRPTLGYAIGFLGRHTELQGSPLGRAARSLLPGFKVAWNEHYAPRNPRGGQPASVS